MTETALNPELKRKLWSRTAIYLVVVAVLLFGAAGTVRWPAAWVYLALSAVMSIAGGLWLARHDPALLEERLGAVIQRDQKGWDRAFMLAMSVLWFGWLVLMALDARRYHWSDMPLALQVLGFILICLGSWIIGLTFRENSYAAPVVKIQKDRAHKVIRTGPYSYVRHPMYAGALLLIPGVPLLLGSWWGLAASLVFIVLLAGRAVLEERTLKAELDGYAAYAARVRYRLLPHVW
ncbi:MAG: isoprenylcysteine carboxylmethyltransferase family protein [Hyphomicrobiales bacterium]